MNRPGKYRTLARLARGTEFHLSAMPADTKSWKVLRHTVEGTTMVERQHEDKTLKVQYPTSQLMVFVPDHDLTELAEAREARGIPAPEDRPKDWGEPELAELVELGDIDILDLPDTVSYDAIVEEQERLARLEEQDG